MTYIELLVPRNVIVQTTESEREWLESVFTRFGGSYPTLEQIWKLMNEAWLAHGCDAAIMDERIAEFYSHPVWLLNGLFIEQHSQSIDNRRCFTEWVAQRTPRRVADYGGGFGSLARMIGLVCPDAAVEVIEPHPHSAAIALAEQTGNVRYESELTGDYDILIATDVFEHVPDPLLVAARTSASLHPGGRYLIANCFRPVISCHLPQTFHFRHSWNYAMEAMGMKPGEVVAYGRAFVRTGNLSIEKARSVEQLSKRLFTWTRWLPDLIGRQITLTVFRNLLPASKQHPRWKENR